MVEDLIYKPFMIKREQPGITPWMLTPIGRAEAGFAARGASGMARSILCACIRPALKTSRKRARHRKMIVTNAILGKPRALQLSFAS